MVIHHFFQSLVLQMMDAYKIFYGQMLPVGLTMGVLATWLLLTRLIERTCMTNHLSFFLNHHGETTSFVAALVCDETIETYKWV
jgi:hypothetical protein